MGHEYGLFLSPIPWCWEGLGRQECTQGGVQAGVLAWGCNHTSGNTTEVDVVAVRGSCHC